MWGIPVSTRFQVVTILLVLGATTFSVGSRIVMWLGSWGELGRALEDATVLTYPVIAGIAAWVASEPRRRRYRYSLDTATRPAVEIYARTSARIAILAWAGLAPVAVVAAVMTGNAATFSGPSPWVLLAVMCGFLTTSALGVLAGTVLPSFLGPVVAGALVYVAEFVALTSTSFAGPLAGLTISDARERTYRETAAWMLGLRSLWLIALAWVLVVLAAKASSQWLPSLAVMCVCAAPLLLVGEAGMTMDRSALASRCHRPQRSVEICLTAARDHLYPQVWSALRPEIDDFAGLATRWDVGENNLPGASETSLTQGRLRVRFTVVNGLHGDAHIVDRKALQAAFSTNLLQRQCTDAATPNNSGKPPASPQDAVQRWTLSRLSVPADGTGGFNFPLLDSSMVDYRPLGRFPGLFESFTPAQRRSWLSENGRALISCSLTADSVTPR